MNLIQHEERRAPERVKLRRKWAVNLLGFFLLIALVLLLWNEYLPFPFVWLFFLFWLLDLLPGEQYFLTRDYIQRGEKKLLNTEVESTDRLLFWYVITDQFRARIWVPYVFLTPDSKLALDRWLADEPKRKADPGSDGNGGKPPGSEREP